MLINSDSTTNRTSILINEYLKLLASGINTEKILVLVQNSKKKIDFLNAIKDKSPIGNMGCTKIYSFFGLCYNYIIDNWALIENSIKDTTNPKIIPNLCGLEVSQYIFKKCIEQVDFTGYNSRTSLLHQLLRRNSLINLNDLTKEEIEKRTKILNESYSKEVNQTINKYKLETINYRAFDYLRQINLFQFLYKKLDNTFDYVFIDDGDEITPAVLSYIEHIRPSVKKFFIGYDSNGSSRLGYLGAININFENLLNEKAIRLEKNEKTTKALEILDNVKNDILINDSTIETKSFLKRNEMVDDVLDKIKKLVIKGVKLSEIAIITPLSDEFLKTALLKSGYNFNFLTKNEKLNQNKFIGYILELLKMINDKNNLDVSSYVLKGIFIELLNLDRKETIKIIQQYKSERDFKNINIFDLMKEYPDVEGFSQLIEIYEKIRFEKLSIQLYTICTKFIPIDKEISKDIIKINQLLKQITDFEDVFMGSVSNLELINQLENTIVSENPLSDEEIEDDAIVVSSAQKIIDYSYRTKYQFLLDTKSESWLKQDIGPLYNAWVMQKTWSQDSFELDDNINLTKDRTARIIYKLFLLTEKTYLYSSIYDSLGQENFFGIDKFFEYTNNNESKKSSNKQIIPRPDQQAVLDYKGGLMSVSATAGSGKTTIMLLLVDKILSGEIIKNIEPQNIFVLTFMESAARNFKERIKAKYPNLKELPNISTIHGLALRIIKENNNYSKLDLDYNIEIIDEIKRSAILNEIIYQQAIASDKIELYDSAISTYKNELILYDNYKCTNKVFLNIFNSYQKKLKEQNLIDYDDLLTLSLKLLKENKDILDYYQNQVKIIIEDEAQDSSFVQQSLITLLGAKNKNIIRCGDINQAITSTFTNSDVAGFREFIKNSTNIEMDRCQRCATGVLDYANSCVNFSKEKNIEPFSSLVMKPVEGKNIIDKKAVETYIFENEKEEEASIVQKIKTIFKNDPNASIAILLRSNFEINDWDNILREKCIQTYKNSDALINNPVYRVVLLIMQYILNPYDIKLIKEIAYVLQELGYYDLETLKYAQNLNEPLFLRDDFDEPFFWDMNYFLYKNHYSMYDLAYEIGNFYFSKTLQIQNITLVCAIVQKINLSQKTFENTVQKLFDIRFKNNFSNIKFFAADDTIKISSKVQIMTIHKSKGDEFDYVFIPKLTEDNLCCDITTCKLKEKSQFIQKIKKFPKDDLELKKDIVEENFRLIYVGITRAKKKLFISSSKKYKYFSQLRDYKPSEIIEGVKVE